MSYRDLLRTWLKRDEGVRYRPYDDATGAYVRASGFVTIGVGRNLDAKPLSDAAVDFILDEDMRDAEADARAVLGDSLFDSLSDVRKAVICDIAFNVGRKSLEGFHRMLAALQEARWADAGQEITDSKLAPARAKRLEDAMRTDQA